MSPHTLRKALSQASITSDESGCYSTSEICAAIFGSMHQEKLATQREIRRKLELENAITTAGVLDRVELEKGLAVVADAMVHRIRASGLDRSAQEDLLKELAGIAVIFENVARGQTRLRGAKNGAVEEDGLP